MPKKIATETIKKIVDLFTAGKNDSEIAVELNVSSSYVNKLRHKYAEALINYEEVKKNKLRPEYAEALINYEEVKKDVEEKQTKNRKTKKKEPEYSIVEDQSDIDDIKLIELKINALKRTIGFYEDLLRLKKLELKNKKK